MEKIEELSPLIKLDIYEHVNYYVEDGLSTNDAIKQVAKDRGVAKRDIYNHFHQKK